jgi:WD40 repeat protein
VWDADKGQEIFSLTGHTSLVTCVAFSPDGKRIVTGSGDPLNPGRPGEVKMWDADKGQEILSLKGHTEQVTSIAFSPDGKHIVTGSWDKTAKVWDADKGQEFFSLKGHTNIVISVTFSPDGQRIYGWDAQKKVLAWSLRDGQTVEPDNPPPEPPPGPAVAPDGRLRAEPQGYSIAVFDPRRVAEDNVWPLPDATERRRYHTEQAALAEKEKQWFAVAFHLGRLLLDNPDDAELKQRREEALRRHAGVAP